MITKKCRQCGKEFTLTDGEIDFFKSKGLELPSRCADCRKKNKAARNAPAADGKKRPIVAVVVVLLILFALGFGYYIWQINGAKLSNNDISEEISSTVQTTVSKITETSTVTEEDTTAEVTEENTTAEVTEVETTAEVTEASTSAAVPETESPAKQYRFRNSELLDSHYKKHIETDMLSILKQS